MPTADLLLAGAGHDQIPFLRYCRERGVTVVAVDADPEAEGRTEADHFEVGDIADAAVLGTLAESYKVRGVTSYITEAAYLAMRVAAKSWGLPVLSWLAAEATLDKRAMRSRLSAFAVPLPHLCRSPDVVHFPVVVKPRRGSAQRGVVKVDSISDTKGWHGAPSDLRAIQKRTLWDDVETGIVEHFVPGTEVNAVYLVHDGKPLHPVVSDRIGYPDGKAFGIVQTHRWPSHAYARETAQLDDIMARIAQALWLQYGVLHVQAKLTPDDDWVVIELGARVPGGVLAEMYETVTGIDMRGPWLDLALTGRFAAPEAIHRHGAVHVHFLNGPPGPLKPGRVLAAHGIGKARQVPGVLAADYYWRREWIHPLRDGGDRFFWVMGAGENDETVTRSIAEAASKLRFDVDPLLGDDADVIGDDKSSAAGLFRKINRVTEPLRQDREPLTEEGAASLKRGLADQEAGRSVTLEEYEQGKRP